MKNEILSFGLDLGLNNVGNSVVRIKLQGDEIDLDLLSTSSYIFTSPLVNLNKPKEGYKLAERGQARRARRTIRRRSQRKRALYKLLAELGLLPFDRKERTILLCKNKEEGRVINPYALRLKALDGKLQAFELGRVLSHLANHRGFMSPRVQRLGGIDESLLSDKDLVGEEVNSKETAKEEKDILDQISHTRELIEYCHFRTLGELCASFWVKGKLIRLKTKAEGIINGEKGKNGKEDKPDKIGRVDRKFELNHVHIRSDRKMIRDEFELICSKQKANFPLLSEKNISRIGELIFYQRPIENDKDRRGFCSFYPDERRIYRASFAAQKFAIAQMLSNLRVYSAGKEERKLISEERTTLCNALLGGVDITWVAAKALLKVDPKTHTFNREKIKGQSASGKIEKLRASKTAGLLADCIPFEKWDLLDYQRRVELVGDLISVNTNYKESQTKRRFELLKNKTFVGGVKFTESEAAKLISLELPKGTLNLSLKMVRKLTPLLLAGFDYSEACEKLGFNHSILPSKNVKVTRLSPEMANGILHPGVRCSVLNAYRVINSMIDQYGIPDEIHIELPRDLAKSELDKAIEEKRQKDQAKIREDIKKDLRAAGLSESRENIMRVLLCKESNNYLIYEPGKKISSIQEACSADFELDHIVPRSHSLDNSIGNMVLCSAQVNRIKSGRTPFEAFNKNDELWNGILAQLESLKDFPQGKKRKIAATTRPADFAAAQLTATGYISREILKAVQKLEGDIQVIVSPGKATGMLRRKWGLDKIVPLHETEQAELDAVRVLRENGDRDAKVKSKFRSNYKHHALDAIVIALSSRSILQKVTQYYKEIENPHTERPEFPLPCKDFRKKVIEAIDKAIVVHKPNHKWEGLINEGTARKPERDIPDSRPFSAKLIDKKLYRFDGDGKAFAYYVLGNNHHLSLFKDNKGKILCYVASVAEVYENVRFGFSRLVKVHPLFPDATYLISIYKNDMIEMEDGRIGVISSLSALRTSSVDAWIWRTDCAVQIGSKNKDDSYLIMRALSSDAIKQWKAVVKMDPLGKVISRREIHH